MFAPRQSAAAPLRIPHDAPAIVYAGPWKVVPAQDNIHGHMGYGGPASELSLTFHGTGMTLEFWTHSWSGQVVIAIDGQEQTHELYSSSGAFKRIRVGNLPDGHHILRLRGSAQRHPQSQGLEVIFVAATVSRGSAAEADTVVEVLGHHMLVHDSQVDQFISTELAANGIFEPFETAWVSTEIRPGDTVLDLGANIGYYTLLFARLVGPSGKVYAFEPDPANCALLEKNIQRNGYTNVVLVPQAVAAASGVLRLYRAATNQGDHRAYDSGDGRSAIEVPAIALDDFFAGNARPIDFIKMDIQGSEFAALSGMQALLRRQPHLKMVTEFWPFGLSRAGVVPTAYLDLLEAQGLELFEMDESRQAVQRLDRAALAATLSVEKQNFTNLLGVKSAWNRGPLTPSPRFPPLPALFPGDLRSFEKKISSQNGEDGIIEEIFRRIGTTTKFFVEFGVETGIECNCACLVRRHHWRGLFIEADAAHFAGLAENYQDCPAVALRHEKVSAANIQQILQEANVPLDLDLLSIDIDGNDYWVWSAIRDYRPRLVVIEYNASFPPPQKWVMKENPDHCWAGTADFSASLASLAALGKVKGYTLVACDSRGVNAFFVRSDLHAEARFPDPAIFYLYSPPAYGAGGQGHSPARGEGLEI